MARLTFVVLALPLLTAQSAVLRSEDAHERVERSPYEDCDHGLPYLMPFPAFPPPPRVFHARHWTGYARNADGSQEGVFSGAAAEARDAQLSGQAFSLASSGTDTGVMTQKQNSLNQGDLNQGTPGGYGSKGTYNSNYKESHFAYNSGGDKLSGGSNTGFEGNQQQAQSNGFKSSGYGSHGSLQATEHQAQSGGYNSGYGSSQAKEQDVQSGRYSSAGYGVSHGGYGGNQQQTQTGGYRSPGYGRSQVGFASNQQLAQGLTSDSQSQTQNSGGSAAGYEGRGDQGQVAQVGKYGSFGYGSGAGYGGTVDQGHTEQFGKYSSPSSATGYGVKEDEGQVAQIGKYSSVSSGSLSTGSGYGAGKQDTAGSHYSSGHGYQNSGAAGHDEQQQVQSFESEHNSKGYGNDAGSGTVGTGAETGVGFGVGGNLDASGQVGAQESAQSALGGALKLATDGLQTAQQTGCSTCGKSSYALSNAKSHSGSAIALSIGG